MSSSPNRAAVEDVIAAYERLQSAITKLHVPHFLELSLTLAQLKTLYLVAADGPLRMSAIAERLGTALSTTSGVVDGLVQQDLLERGEDPSDRRQVLVRVTRRGHETLEDFHDMGRTRFVELLGRIEPGDLQTIHHAIDLLADAAGVIAEDRN